MQTNKEKQDKRKAEMQAAAERDGFATASAAITAWKNGKARLTQRAADGAYWCGKCRNWSKNNRAGNCVLCNTPRR
jgi:hypothetical protein